MADKEDKRIVFWQAWAFSASACLCLAIWSIWIIERPVSREKLEYLECKCEIACDEADTMRLQNLEREFRSHTHKPIIGGGVRDVSNKD